MPVHKLTLQVTVFTYADELSEAVDTYSNMDLDDIAEAIDSGEDIGSNVKIVASETIHDHEQLQDELLQIGNDGTFFDNMLATVDPDDGEEEQL